MNRFWMKGALPGPRYGKGDIRSLERKMRGLGDPSVVDRLFGALHAGRDMMRPLFDRVGALNLPRDFVPLCDFLPMISGSVLGLHAQCAAFGKRDIGPSFDGEWSTQSNETARFAVRAMPYIAGKWDRRSSVRRIIHASQDGHFAVTGGPARATLYDMIAAVRSCRRLLPRECAIVTTESYFRGTYDMKDSRFGTRYAGVELRGPRMTLRGFREEDFVDGPCLVLSYVDTSLDLLL